MISYHNGDLLESGCDIICHQCNLDCVFGGGLAKQISERYPDIEEHCKNTFKKYLGDDNPLGSAITYISDDYIIWNAFTQKPNYNTDYSALESCFMNLRDFATRNVCPRGEVCKIGVPFNYGCGIANGDWSIVEEIFRKIFEDVQAIDFQIWKL